MNGEGGSYIREKDGSLRLVSRTEPQPEPGTVHELAIESAAGAPAEPQVETEKPVNRTGNGKGK